MTWIWNSFAGFIADFDGWNYFYIERNILEYITFSLLAFFCMFLYLGSVYVTKKSKKKLKYISQSYTIFQKILLIHYSQNLYKKIDRFWFDIVHKFYLLHLILFGLVLLLTILCHYFPAINLYTAIVFLIHCMLMALIIIAYFLGTKTSPTGGVRFRYPKKYDRKNW